MTWNIQILLNVVIPTVKFGGGLQALVKINGIMKSTEYQAILAENLVASTTRLRLGCR